MGERRERWGYLVCSGGPCVQEGGRTPGRARRASWDATRRGCATVEALAQGGAAAGEATRGGLRRQGGPRAGEGPPGRPSRVGEARLEELDGATPCSPHCF